MQWGRSDVAIVSRCTEDYFSIMGDNEVECIEEVETFKYLGWMLDRSDNDWLAIPRNVRNAHLVWIRLQPLPP